MSRREADFVTSEQIEAARSVGTLEYLQRYEPQELTKTYTMNGKIMHCKAGEYRTVTHDSLSVKGTWYYWWSRGEGGALPLIILSRSRRCHFRTLYAC